MKISSPRWVDFHCHLDLYPDLADAISVCEEARVATLAVTTTPKAFRHNLQLASKTEFVRVGLGLHPHLAHERWNELPLFEALLPETRYVGEIGLDAGPRFYRSMDRQTEVFRRILTACAKQGDKILSVHSVRTASQILDHVAELLPASRGKVVLHWFSGSATEAKRAIELGCFFSINQAMFRSERAMAVIKKLPTDRLLTETDGPFVEVNGRPIRPGDAGEATRLLAEISGMEPAEMRNRIVKNLATLVGSSNSLR
ncbi:Qat anti-phage system TatD family nuclease QatD [Mesorhizobium sp.]|uniref:Qat anti-phage system TatD family nuclease QatD n=1 Tax=Mesorhizobium sp. TaxID=1871066 RepID=UPI000FE3D03F|nr:Qat anti-phage system TatD family nuclease QatD [Mesorhizobium sp.]RWA64053.1 MAG: TatD family deoxyribonuclease [Mesorhizobium sp.]RWB95409.1 MAG: TatD family deoxyribonuclease [Mesorhizobium sp.]RWG81097.1 MAG: TatD family deoxyribonuclease [Mesorhizobium sp.]RWK15184.1 MAG: TatD family deoxyribonuclease [Mesorhizobium sp.]